MSARGVRSWAVVRLLQGPIAHGSTWDEEGGKISSPLGDRSGVFQCPGVDGGPVMLLSGWLTAGCNFRRNGWDMLFIWVCAGECGAAEVEDCSEKPGFDDALWVQDWGGEVGMCRELPS